ncbi:MAG: hypothetical protein JRI23_30955 [Deltaproteobacteria bacterium]|nr:hypothetical protein [Deltaproteobacteria bacterium]MBW2536621.1 hypothetical protein [Deltaproteobacteria bacterium]
MPARAPTIEVLVTPGCASRESTMMMVAEVAAELAPAAEIAEVVVQTPADAQALRFLGSPSVRIDGRDVDATAADREDFALG